MDEMALGASVAELLQDPVISSQDVQGFLAELCDLSAVPSRPPSAAKHCQFSVLGVPLALDNGASAALNLFAAAVNAFDAEATQKAESFALLAEKALRLAVRGRLHSGAGHSSGSSVGGCSGQSMNCS